MSRQEKVLDKKRGRPAIGKGVQLNTQLRPEMAEALDAWAAEQPDMPSRPEAIRRVLSERLSATKHLGSSAASTDAQDGPAQRKSEDRSSRHALRVAVEVGLKRLFIGWTKSDKGIINLSMPNGIAVQFPKYAVADPAMLTAVTSMAMTMLAFSEWPEGSPEEIAEEMLSQMTSGETARTKSKDEG